MLGYVVIIGSLILIAGSVVAIYALRLVGRIAKEDLDEKGLRTGPAWDKP